MADPIDPTNGDDKAAKLAELKAKMEAAKAKRLAAEAEAPDPAEAIAGNPAAGSRTPAAPLGEVPTDAAATPESQGGKPVEVPDDAHAAATPAASAPPPPGPAVDDKAAKLAELQAKMAAAKAKRETEGAATPAAASATASASAAASASGTAASAQSATSTATATATAPPPDKGSADSRIAAMRARIAESRSKLGAPLPKKAVKQDVDAGTWFFGRRNFLQSVGWMSFFGFLTIVIVGAIRSMFPRVIYERPPIFKAGFPGDYVPGVVSEKYKDEERVWIIRQNDGSFIALLAICTHLGCTPRWLSSENKFKCPCHGSGFRGTPNYGVHFEGPAPRPLERLAITLAPDGQLLIDTSQKRLWEKGQWEAPDAMLKA